MDVCDRTDVQAFVQPLTLVVKELLPSRYAAQALASGIFAIDRVDLVADNQRGLRSGANCHQMGETCCGLPQVGTWSIAEGNTQCSPDQFPSSVVAQRTSLRIATPAEFLRALSALSI